MKTTFKLRMALGAFITVLFSLLPKITQAQTVSPPYTIVNHLQCSVIIGWELWDNTNCALCTSGTATLAAQGPGNSVVLTGVNFGTCAPGCNIYIEVNDIGGPITPVTANTSSGPVALPVSACTGSAPDILCGFSACHINY